MSFSCLYLLCHMSGPAFTIIYFSVRKTDPSTCFLGTLFLYKMSYQKYEQRNIDYIFTNLSGVTA